MLQFEIRMGEREFSGRVAREPSDPDSFTVDFDKGTALGAEESDMLDCVFSVLLDRYGDLPEDPRENPPEE